MKKSESYQPQLATLSDNLPLGDDWIVEPKFDGYRMGAVRTKNGIQLLTRNGLDWSNKFPTIKKELTKILPPNTVVDGELMAKDEKGKGSFQTLQRIIKDSSFHAQLDYYIFDILSLRGKDVRALPLDKRRTLLSSVIKGDKGHIHDVKPFEEEGEEALNHSIALGYEGVITKRLSATYMPGRNATWLKIKPHGHEEFAVVGYTHHSKIKGQIGAILIGLHVMEGMWLYCGKVGTGFDTAERRKLWKLLEPTKTEALTMLNPELVPQRCELVAPMLVVEVNFTEWTADGALRHPSYISLREDKKATQVLASSSSHPQARHIKKRLQAAR